MASLCARAKGTLQTSTFSATRNAVSKLSFAVSKPSLSSGTSKFIGSAASPKPNSATRFSNPGLFNSSRLPVELGCASSLMPLHSATASALFTSLLSLHSQNWGSLSEGFATPL